LLFVEDAAAAAAGDEPALIVTNWAGEEHVVVVVDSVGKFVFIMMLWSSSCSITSHSSPHVGGVGGIFLLLFIV
jgi:hypothetical protein